MTQTVRCLFVSMCLTSIIYTVCVLHVTIDHGVTAGSSVYSLLAVLLLNVYALLSYLYTVWSAR